jgi:hypothetical protein
MYFFFTENVDTFVFFGKENIDVFGHAYFHKK